MGEVVSGRAGVLQSPMKFALHAHISVVSRQ